jgi:hypothetical protein
MSRKSNRVARFSGLALAGAGLAHFTSPWLWEPITKSAFPRNTRQHVYTDGGIETVLGLGFSSRQTRRDRLSRSMKTAVPRCVVHTPEMIRARSAA